jgi:hypothetical protein
VSDLGVKYDTQPWATPSPKAHVQFPWRSALCQVGAIRDPTVPEELDMQTRIMFVAAVAVTGACREVAISTPHAVPDVSENTAAVLPIGCSRNWAAPVDGLWTDANNWTPNGAPAAGDSVCITVAGTYEVTLDNSATIKSLKLGGTGVSAKLTMQGTNNDALVMTGNAIVRAGSRLLLGGTANRISVAGNGGLTNDGIIKMLNGCGCPQVEALIVSHLVNNGSIELLGTAIIQMIDPQSTFTNNGAILVTSRHGAAIQGFSSQSRVDLVAGNVTGTATLFVDGAEISWSGGTLDANASDTARAVLRARETTVTLMNTSLSGRVDVQSFDGDTSTVEGTIGAGVRIDLIGTEHGTFTFANSLGQPVVNDGTLRVVSEGVFAGADHTDLSFVTFVNHGRLELSSTHLVEVDAINVINDGTITSTDTVRLIGNTHRLTNEGTISITGTGRLEMDGGTLFEAATGSTMTGTLLLDNATLTGIGTVGDVISAHGTIEPGLSLGTLTASSLVMDATSALEMEIGGTTAGTFDQLVVTGNVTYAGTLAVVSALGFTGGFCGDVVTIITDNSSGARGAFSKFQGMRTGLVSAWRVHNPVGAYTLAGHFPVEGVHLNESFLDVAEGAGSMRYQICLGTTAPTADVVVSQVRAFTQIEVAPSSLTFTPANWPLPQTVTVVPINDGVIEGAHSDSVVHSVSSTDPLYNLGHLVTLPVNITDNDDEGLRFARGFVWRREVEIHAGAAARSPIVISRTELVLAR